jgi:hypothetical protein
MQKKKFEETLEILKFIYILIKNICEQKMTYSSRKYRQ